MIIGGEKISGLSETVLERLEEINALIEVNEVFVIVAVQFGEGRGSTFYYCTSDRPYTQYGLLETAHTAVDDNLKRKNA